MKTCWILIFVSLIFVTKLLGQTELKEFQEAENLSANDRFDAALPHYLNLLKSDSSNANLNFKIGICYLNSRSQKAKAVYFLNKAIMPTTSYYSEGSKKHTNNPIIAYKFLGTCHLSYNFEQLDKTCEKFEKIIFDSKDKDLTPTDLMNLKTGINKIGEELKAFNASSINLKIENTDKNHHPTFVDYSSVSLPDQSIIFNFQRHGSKDGEPNEERLLFEDANTPMVQTATVNAITRIDSLLFEKDNGNEATVATSDDKQTILIYKDDAGDGNLYISRLKGNQWSTPEKVDKTINTKGWEPNECISADGNTLYFTSNRQGGFGGMDIYKSKKLPNGEWGKATNLGPSINTPYDERAPFIHTDGVTLYFSSSGHKTIGRFDIFTSTLSDSGTWSKPLNIGYPATKIQDETLYPVAADNKKNNSQMRKLHGDGLEKTVKKSDSNEKDNYTVVFNNQKQVSLTLLKGNVIDRNGKVPEDLEITINDNETGATAGVYNSNDKSGNYLFILPPEKNNNITFHADGHLFYSDNVDLSDKKTGYEINKAVQMPLIAAGSKIVLNNIFFDSAKATLLAVSKVELNNLFHLLSTNPSMVVIISDYMTSKENVKYNKELTKQRSQAIQKYLIEKGINKENIIAKGYVKAKDNEIKNQQNKNSYLNKNQLNQWVELKITEIK